VCWTREKHICRTGLNDPSGVHHGDSVRKLGHHGEVVGHIQGCDLVRRSQLADGRQHRRLGCDVEPGGGFVKDDQLRPVGKRHGQTDSLLLTSRKLMRVPSKECRVIWESHPAHQLSHARVNPRTSFRPMRCKNLSQLQSDSKSWVERRSRILRHIGYVRTPNVAQFVGTESEYVPASQLDRAATNS
jgi:hypothetical protein